MALQAGREPRLDPGAVLQVAELLPAPRLPAQRALRDRVHCGEKAGRRSVHTHIYTHIYIHTLHMHDTHTRGAPAVAGSQLQYLKPIARSVGAALCSRSLRSRCGSANRYRTTAWERRPACRPP